MEVDGNFRLSVNQHSLECILCSTEEGDSYRFGTTRGGECIVTTSSFWVNYPFNIDVSVAFIFFYGLMLSVTANGWYAPGTKMSFLLRLSYFTCNLLEY